MAPARRKRAGQEPAGVSSEEQGRAMGEGWTEFAGS
jgi:hypothetical protein